MLKLFGMISETMVEWYRRNLEVAEGVETKKEDIFKRFCREYPDYVPNEGVRGNRKGLFCRNLIDYLFEEFNEVFTAMGNESGKVPQTKTAYQHVRMKVSKNYIQTSYNHGTYFRYMQIAVVQMRSPFYQLHSIDMGANLFVRN